MIDLSDYTGGSDFTLLYTATGINNAGDIIGEGLTTSGERHAFLLTPTDDSTAVPEPATIMLTVLGLSSMAARLRRSTSR